MSQAVQEWLPEGWGYEGPDESVGIFGEAFFHEDCPLEEDVIVEIAEVATGKKDERNSTEEFEIYGPCRCGAELHMTHWVFTGWNIPEGE